MKIKPEHFAILEEACNKVIEDNPTITEETYTTQGLTNKRFRWDVLYAAKINNESSSRWICDNLYSYMDDTHIDTALRKILA